MKMKYLKNVVTLDLNSDKCTSCGICLDVCPREVLAEKEGRVVIKERDACIECGACALNCPFSAIKVRVGVGCAAALIKASLTGGEATCGCSEGTCC